MRKPPTTTPARSTPSSSPSARNERARRKPVPSSLYFRNLINPQNWRLAAYCRSLARRKSAAALDSHPWTQSKSPAAATAIKKSSLPKERLNPRVYSRRRCGPPKLLELGRSGALPCRTSRVPGRHSFLPRVLLGELSTRTWRSWRGNNVLTRFERLSVLTCVAVRTFFQARRSTLPPADALGACA